MTACTHALIRMVSFRARMNLIQPMEQSYNPPHLRKVHRVSIRAGEPLSLRLSGCRTARYENARGSC